MKLFIYRRSYLFFIEVFFGIILYIWDRLLELEKMPQHEYNTRTKETASYSDELSKLKAELFERFDSVTAEISNLKDVIIENLRDENMRLRNRIELLENKAIIAETVNNNIEQYGRRNNIEITGIPDSVSKENFEKTVIEVCNKLNMEITEKDIEACHRIGAAKPKKTICRFVNRKNVKNLLYSRKKLKDLDVGLGTARLNVNENLTNYNSKLAYNCRKLKRKKLINKCFTIDGNVYLQRTEGERSKKISHMTTLEELYPRFDFEDDTTNTNEFN